MADSPGNDRQRRARAFLPALEDREFLMRDELRGLRFSMEYYKADLLMREWGVRSTVVVFGSARIPAPEAVEALLAAAPAGAARQRAERQARLAVWYERARAFARLVSVRGGALTLRPDRVRDNVIATGGGPGIMEAANRGAADVGAPSIGFNIGLPHEQEPNEWSTPSLTFSFHYFAMRKMHLAMRANALAVFPGGFGTLDEMFEILTLQQTGKAPTMPVVLFGRDYWQRIVRFDALVEEGVIDEGDLALFDIVDTPEEGWESMRRRGLHAHTPFAEAPNATPHPVDAES
ncbi:cytokinin riboside 5'-monophosphate phosphoribohydrolase [Allostella sp. ATCC 35155]|nr:cytokinin riboside 5'-monophosphate phosphoribohydrolase [Stella sp. ATCC 35155]